jgi:uncharacterized protein YrrD
MMRKVNDLYGKQVINQATGEKVASIRDIVLSDDARRISALVVGDGMWANDERAIRWDSVISTGDFVIVQGAEPFAPVAEDTEIEGLRKQSNQITGTMVVTTAGERLGTIGDMFFDTRGQIIGYSIKQGMMSGSDDPFLPAEQVQVVGKDAVIATSGELMSMKNVDFLDDTPQDPIPSADPGATTRELRKPTDEELREHALGEPFPVPPEPTIPRMPHTPMPDDRGIN